MIQFPQQSPSTYSHSSESLDLPQYQLPQPAPSTPDLQQYQLPQQAISTPDLQLQYQLSQQTSSTSDPINDKH